MPCELSHLREPSPRSFVYPPLVTGANPTQRPVVVVAGATGFIGTALGPVLARDFRVIGLSRREGMQGAGYDEWRSCDLYSALDAEEALAGADVAVYLVHSMMPSARLTQGSFEDFDLICADNFARAAQAAGVRQIVYVSGLVPKEEPLSRHLRSRVEVEQALGQHGVPLTTLRAGLVIGAGGSSLEMLIRLVRRLPAMACPRWTRTRTQPIALSDLVALLRYCVGREAVYGETFDVGMPEATTYLELMAMCGEILDQRRPMVAVPLLSPRLSRLWVSAVTGAPKALVGPIIESLKHEMLAGDSRLQDMAGIPGMSLREALSLAISERKRGAERPLAFHGASRLRQESLVRSIQRMTLPEGRDAAWAAKAYLSWLPSLLWPLLRASVDERGGCDLYWRLSRTPLLQLVLSKERSASDHQLFYIVGGLLARPGGGGRFELRQILDGRTLITAIHDYRPRLPWFLYAATQAPVHAFVMAAFRRYLRGGGTTR